MEKNGGGKSRATVPLTTKYIKVFKDLLLLVQ
jgi:hypothetical protein